jgi:hypothetical protein
MIETPGQSPWLRSAAPITLARFGHAGGGNYSRLPDDVCAAYPSYATRYFE